MAENDTNARLVVARGDGVGGFAPPASVTIGPVSFPGFAGFALRAVGDVDGDGMADALVSAGYSLVQPMSILFGAPAPALPTLVNVPSPHASFYHGIITDFDRDGISDVVEDAFLQVAGSWRSVVVFRGLGARQFSAPIVLDSVDFSSALFSTHKFVGADLDGDQDVELVRSLSPLGAPATFTLYENQTAYGGGCPGTAGTNPTIGVGLAAPGNAAFAITLEAALPSAPAVLGVSLARSPVSGCGVGLNLGLASLILPTSSLGVTTTDSTGAAAIGLPLPPGIAGAVAYAQWAVLDPAGTFGFAGQPFALTRARTILVW